MYQLVCEPFALVPRLLREPLLLVSELLSEALSFCLQRCFEPVLLSLELTIEPCRFGLPLPPKRDVIADDRDDGSAESAGEREIRRGFRPNRLSPRPTALSPSPVKPNQSHGPAREDLAYQLALSSLVVGRPLLLFDRVSALG